MSSTTWAPSKPVASAPVESDSSNGLVREHAPSDAPKRHRAGEQPVGHKHRSAHEQVAGLQRARLLTAMVEAVAEQGAGGVSVSDVVARSGVSRRTFYELFRDREDCLLVALDDALARVSERVTFAYNDAGDGWATRLRRSLAALLAFLDSDPAARRLLIVESLAAGPRVLEERQRVLALLAAVVDQGRAQAKGRSARSGTDEGPPLLTAEGIVGGVFSVIHARVVQDEGPLLELLNPLMSMILTPYLGPAAGRRELAKPVPAGATRQSRAAGNPMRGLEMRLTYRTLRVLMELGANPGSSNRQIGEAAGMSDQGQVSKLLSRLGRIGLIENTAGEPGRGGPNAWTLTPRGHELEQLVHERTTTA